VSENMIPDLENAFLEAASAPLEAHVSGTLEEAESILSSHPVVATSSIYAAATLGDEQAVRRFLAQDAASATARGGPRSWDALTYLCFSRYLRLDQRRGEAFVRTAKTLLDAGASARTGWIEMIDRPNPHPIFESAIYGAAGVAHHAWLTRLLLERGAEPNDAETPYHSAETHETAVLQVLLESGKLNANSMSILLLRKCDWHHLEGVRMLLEHRADPNVMTQWGFTPLHQAVRRDD
jgi:hypothetical protein